MILDDRRPTRFLVIALLIMLRCAGALAAFEGDAPDNSNLRAYHAGNGLLQRGLYDLAAAEYRGFLSSHADHEKAPMAHYGLAVSLFHTAKYDEATKELEPLARDKGFAYAADVRTMLGHCYLLAGRLDDAADQFHHVVEDHADHKLAADAAVQLAETLFKAGKHDEASRWCAGAAQRWPKAAQIERFELIAGMADMARADFRGAAPHFESIQTSSPKAPCAGQAKLLLAQCRHQLNEFVEAEKLYRDVLKDQASSFRPDALFGLAVILLHQAHPQEAGKLLDELLAKDASSPVASRAKLQRGRAYFDVQAYDKAFAAFQEYSKSAPSEASDEAAYWIAKCDLKRGNFDAAASRLNEAIDSHPKGGVFWGKEI